MKTVNIIEVIKNEFNIKLYPMDGYYVSKNYKVYLREYQYGVFVAFKLTRKGINIEISKTIRTDQDLLNLIKLIKKARGLK